MKKILIVAILAAASLTGCSSNASGEIEQTQIAEEQDKREVITDEVALKKAMDFAWEAYVTQETANEKRLAEINQRAMTFGEATMKYGLQKKGSPDENGYPVYIALHGGGQSDTPDINDQQWAAMATYYGNCVKNGIYINPRGVRDTWNCHFNDESYALYDELIENLILFYQADPNRIYLMGYSAGGDGVYAISPRMADRFAAVNMSAGHPNGVSLLNLMNVPIALQVGIKDDAYDRNKVTCEYGMKLDELQKEYGEEYFKHETWVHLGYAHNFIDYKNSEQPVIDDYALWYENEIESEKNVDTNAVHFVMQYTRNPIPDKLIWDLSTRGIDRANNDFYWLEADSSVTQGIIKAGYSKEENRITVEASNLPEDADFNILLNSEMLDLFSPITVETPSGTTVITIKEIDPEIIWNTTVERGDKNFQFAYKISYKSLN